MGRGASGDFAENDRRAAANFAAAARARRAAAPDLPRRAARRRAPGSAHLRSREEVARGPRRRRAPEFVHARAAMVIGADSASFLMLRQLVERLPAMVGPKWIDTRTQPIAARDVTGALARLATFPAPPAEVRARRRRRPHLPRDDAPLRGAPGPAPAADRPGAACSRRGSRRTGSASSRPSSRRSRARSSTASARSCSCARLRRRGSTTTRSASTTPFGRPSAQARPYHRATHEASAEAPGGPDRRLRRDLPRAEARPRQPDDRRPRDDRPAARRHVDRPHRRLPLGAVGRRADADRRARRDLDAEAPRAPRAHLLALPQPLHARPRPRRVHRGRALRRAAAPPVRAARVQGAGVRDGRRSAGSCAGASSAACSSRRRASAPTATWRSTCGARPTDDPEWVDLHVEVEVANYYPAIASAFTRWAYAVTQSRIHVLVTYGFLRSLAQARPRGVEDRALRRHRPAAGPRAARLPASARPAGTRAASRARRTR